MDFTKFFVYTFLGIRISAAPVVLYATFTFRMSIIIALFTYFVNRHCRLCFKNTAKV